ncbi:unnamed protein product [Cochlearia groenlandica]
MVRELESSLPSDTAEQDPSPADQLVEERVLSSDVVVMEMEADSDETVRILDGIQERASSSLDEFSLNCEEIKEHYASIGDLLKKLAMEVDLKEKSVMEQSLELEKKKEEWLREVDENERSMTLRLEKKEEENSLKHNYATSVMSWVFKESREEATNELERLSKLNDEKSCELERKVKEFDLKEKEWTETRSKETEFVKESLEKFEAKEKELSLLEEAIKDLSEAAKKEDSFAVELNAKAEEIELKNKSLKEHEKNLGQRERELELKQRELQERLVQGETCKRSREKEADSLTGPAKKHKPQSHDDDDDADKDCAVSLSSSCSEEISESLEEEYDDKLDIHCPDSEFHDFKKSMSTFLVDEIWALYDPLDQMPRLYAKIKRIVEPGLTLEVTWLESRDVASVPVACGRFRYGLTRIIASPLVFSHLMQPIIRRNSFFTVIPCIGETWALFRDWNKSWINNPEQHKPPYRYDLVEVLFSFDDQQGVGVAYLGKVKGFVSVFERAVQRGVVKCMIKPEELHKFSHRVPSFRMNGDEKEGVPADSFELDSAAISSSLLKLDHSMSGSRNETPIVIID